MDKSVLTLNVLGGPGAGKSTTAAGVFYSLKKNKVNCELISEYAKQLVWGDTLRTLDDQLYVFAKQHHKQFICKDKVDVIVTDAPLILSLIYGESLSDNFKNLVLETFNSYNNLNYFIERGTSYQSAGRLQNNDEAKRIDELILNMLVKNNIKFKSIKIDNLPKNIIVNEVMTNYLRRDDKWTTK